jgi:hypothetical protein
LNILSQSLEIIEEALYDSIKMRELEHTLGIAVEKLKENEFIN